MCIAVFAFLQGKHQSICRDQQHSGDVYPKDASQIDSEVDGPSLHAGLVNVQLDDIDLQLQGIDDDEREGSDTHAFLDRLNAEDLNL
jgi:hypothetical protein